MSAKQRARAGVDHFIRPVRGGIEMSRCARMCSRVSRISVAFTASHFCRTESDGLDPPAVPWTYRAAVSLGYTAPKERALGLTTHIHTVNTYMCTVYTVPPCGLSCYPRKNPPPKENGEPRIADMLEISDRKHGMRRVRSGTSRDRYMYDPDALCT